MKTYRKCVVCDSEYEYCSRCGQQMTLPRWMFLFDNENCKDIYETLNAYGAKQITKAEARQKLSTLDITNIKDNYKKIVNDIMAEPVENPAVQEVTEDTSEEAVKPVQVKTMIRNNSKERRNRCDSDNDYNTTKDTI